MCYIKEVCLKGGLFISKIFSTIKLNLAHILFVCIFVYIHIDFCLFTYIHT